MSKTYVVQHTMVGPHRAGDHIEFSADDLKEGRDPERLLRSGAIRHATEHDGPVTKYGHTDEEGLTPFPAVPFESVTSRPPAPDPLRTENTPTRPVPNVPDHTVEVHGKVSHEPKGVK